MTSEPDEFGVPLDGFAMHLRPSELRSVAAGLGELDAADESNLLTLVEAVRALPVRDRAPFWELAVRHYARSKPVEQAAGEIGMDAIRAHTLLQTFQSAIGTVPPPER